MTDQHMGDHFIQEEIANTEINVMKSRIAAISQLPVNAHAEEFDVIHGVLKKALSEIDGI